MCSLPVGKLVKSLKNTRRPKRPNSPCPTCMTLRAWIRLGKTLGIALGDIQAFPGKKSADRWNSSRLTVAHGWLAVARRTSATRRFRRPPAGPSPKVKIVLIADASSQGPLTHVARGHLRTSLSHNGPCQNQMRAQLLRRACKPPTLPK